MIFLTNRFYSNLNSFYQKTFKLLTILITASFLSINVTAQIFIPDDFYPNDAPNESRLFYSNQGQLLKTDGTLANNIDYYNIGSTPSLYLSQDAVSITTKKLSDTEGTPDTVIRVDITPLNSQFGGNLQRISQSSSFVNFYYPHCSQGITQVYGYDRIVYEDYFQGIDLHVTNNGIAPKLFFVVHPEADVNQLELKFKGQDQLLINANNEILMQIEQEIIKIPQLIAYQTDAAGHITNNTLASPTMTNLGGGGIKINAPEYNSEEYLIFEFSEQIAGPTGPTGTGNLYWATFYGGSGFDEGTSIRTDNLNNVYTAGRTNSQDFPTYVSMSTTTGSQDAFASKFYDSHREWATFFGGTSDERGIKLGVTLSSNIIVGGFTYSSDLPLPTVPLPGAYFNNTFLGGQDIFLTKLSASNGNMEHATYFGSNGVENLNDLEASSYTGDIYICGRGNVPNTGTSFSFQTAGNTFFSRFDENLKLIWSSQFGASTGGVSINAIADDSNGNIYLGGVSSPNAITNVNITGNPNAINNPHTSTSSSHDDWFMGKISPTGTHLWVTNYGSSFDFEGLNDIKVGNSAVYFCGFTYDNDIPIFGGSSTPSGFASSFLLKTSTTGEGLFSRYLPLGATTALNQAQEMAIDKDGNVFIVGTSPASFNPTPWLTYYTQNNNGSNDAYIIAYDNNDNLKYKTSFGGNSTDRGYSIDISDDDYLYITGTSFSDILFPWIDPYAHNDNWFENTKTNFQSEQFIAQFSLSHFVSTKNVNTANFDFYVYSNTNKEITIRLNSNTANEYSINIYDILGREVYQNNIYSNDIDLPVRLNVSGGVYIVNISNDSGLVSKKILIK